MANNKISLNIAGLNILVSTPEDEEYVTQIAKEIDASVNAILDKSTGASVTNAILLCTIDYLDSYKKANRTSNNMRSQIKDYMAEAANAKREFDEERRRSEDLSAEIQALRNHLTRIATEGDSSGLFNKIRDDLNAANNELAKQRKRNADLSAQNKTLSEKNDAMNLYISGQDREIARLAAVSEELNTRLLDKTNLITELSDKLSGYETRVSELLGETDNLKTQLDTLANLIDERNVQDKTELQDFDAGMQHETEVESVVETDSDPKIADGQEPDYAKTEPGLKLDFLTDDNPASVLQTDYDDVTPTTDLESDINEAISLVDDKKHPSAGRSMKNFDIDISDLPVTESAPEPPSKSGDHFGDFDIDEDANIVGFESLRRQNDSVEDNHLEESPKKDSKGEDENKVEDHSEKVVVPDEKPKKNALIDENDDTMPNLSWTLDI